MASIPSPVFFKDTHGRYLGCNTAFTDIMGVTNEHIRGKTVIDLWPSDHARVYHQNDLDLLEDQQQQIYEYEIKDKQGDIRPVIYYKNVFRDENGGVAGIVGGFVDISDRVQAEKALRESERNFRMLADNVTDVIWSIDMNLKYTYISPSVKKLRGYTPEQALQMPLEETFTPESYQKVIQIFSEELDREGEPGVDPDRSIFLELDTVRKDGSIIPIEVNATFIRGDTGSPTGIIGTT
ncbi:PAS domain-containing protein [Desulfosarcina variabilis]|uniref:PAS domain-containing protein n=1 Tax=Desulfosarcina variabilis TaxID=2300 RepID=UPI003AFACB3C